MLKFPDLIKKIRKSGGLTQKEFAEAINVSTVLVAMIESGNKEVSKKFILKLANGLSVHPSSITPFLFSDQNLKEDKISFLEKSLIDFGEKMQIYLIKESAKKLRKNEN